MNDIMYKVSPAQIGLYYGRGAQIVHPIKNEKYLCQAVKTDNGTVMIVDRPDLPYSMSIEDLRDIYGGEIIQIEIMKEVDHNDAHYMHHGNFPKVKNARALKKVCKKYDDYFNNLAKKKK